MIGIDTNILIRYLVRDDRNQTNAADNFIDTLTTEEPGVIQPIVLCETAWVLDSAYGYEKKLITETLRQILLTQEFVIPNHETAWSALRKYEKGTADYADYLIQEQNYRIGCATTMTFDKKAAKSIQATLLPY